MIHEVQGAESPNLPDGYVDKHPIKIEFDDFNICLIDKQKIFDMASSLQGDVVSFKYSFDPKCNHAWLITIEAKSKLSKPLG
jgi:hypothetical protein